MTPQTRLNQSAAACIVQLQGAEGLIGVRSERLSLVSADGAWAISAPASAFNGVTVSPSEPAIVTISLVVTRVEPVPSLELPQ